MNSSNVRRQSKQYVHELYNSLVKHKAQSSELYNLTGVLMQVYKKLDHVHAPESLVNRLVNYVNIVGFTNIHFSKKEEQIFMKLEDISQLASWNGLYMADFTDKSLFSDNHGTNHDTDEDSH
ncbi:MULTISPECIES: bacteriocin immunity protein [Lacticaseibacillus]|uniref:Bacteriocin immunity protein n=2 Tax=Lacticaseibacillus TaxID=2759736 RepID=A0AAN1F0M1_LACCA|nr:MULTISPECIES: bacteriocin immunity protein [Lacticaseibacillus]ARY92611.1 hypothetical protein BGL52_12940 [Lacticaseibacillus casei]KAB1969549.1 bacteriocin immunity protein [Lacticaseibacillus casei]WLV80510.1 bacteriocin immunity protein [Lacticaseibacillus sp. NCIMB 15473]WNX24471.1 bacteriocin immunity protein [Lacticaseibacillus casei]WNX27243.1 bacteriocin immunity protein [Lacticaseibacillus casei]